MSKTIFMSADEVAKELSVSKSLAYKIIKTLNMQLQERGYLTVAGRVNRQYFEEKLYCSQSMQAKGD